MGYIIKNLISNVAVLDNIDLNLLMKESSEAHIMTTNINLFLDDTMAQETSTAFKVGSITETLTQLLTRGSGVCLDYMHHDLNMVYNNIVVFQHNLTGLCNIVGNLEQKMHYLYQNDTAQSIKDS